MKVDEFRKVQADVTLLAVFLVAAAAVVLSRLELLSAVSLVLMLLGASFMTAHWWLLGSLVRSLVEGRRFAVLLRGMLSVFPAGAALAVLFVSIRLDRANPFPVLLGILAVPLAMTGISLRNGIAGLRTAFLADGRIHG